MTSDPELEELKRREALAERLGGPARVERQRAAGRLTIRERIARLLDAGTFHEVGKIAGRATYDEHNDPLHHRRAEAERDPRNHGHVGDDVLPAADGRHVGPPRGLGGSADATIKDKHTFIRARRFLSYLPSSIYDLPPRSPQTDDPGRRDPALADAVPRDPRKVYRMRPIVEAVVDRGSFFEIAPLYGCSMITGLARLDGWPVAVMASDPMFYGGAWTADTCQKVERFVDLAQTFHLPVVYLVDCPGFLIGSQAEQTGTIKQGVRAMSAIWQTTVPWCAVIIRNVFGVAGAAHRNGGRYCMRYAWPSGRWGSLPLEGGIEAAYRAELDAAPDPKQALGDIEERLNKLRSPFRSAETFWIEEIIDPRDTRPLLCEFAALAAPLREPGPSSHGMRP